MTPKQHIERLVQLLAKRFPNARVDVDAPARSTGSWFVNVAAADQEIVVEFRPKLGFGISSAPADGYGEGADEFVADEETAANRVVSLFQSRKRTEPQRVRLLQQLREKRRISQLTLADSLGIRQPTVSKIERRDDVALSTLRRYIAALGGELRITAEFSDGTVEIGLGVLDRD